MRRVVDERGARTQEQRPVDYLYFKVGKVPEGAMLDPSEPES